MNDKSLVKTVFDNLRNLDDMGFRNCVTNVRELVSPYYVPLDNELTGGMFILKCEHALGRKL